MGTGHRSYPRRITAGEDPRARPGTGQQLTERLLHRILGGVVVRVVEGIGHKAGSRGLPPDALELPEFFPGHGLDGCRQT